jgi:hypothetical protein
LALPNSHQDVGTNTIYKKQKFKRNKNASHLGTPFGLATMLEKREKSLGVVTQPKEGSFVCFMAEIGQHFPLIWREPAKTTSYCLLEMLQNTHKS